MIYNETVAVYSKNHTSPINTFCMQNIDYLNFKAGGTYIYRCALKGY
jgi:hypothetical protein